MFLFEKNRYLVKRQGSVEFLLYKNNKIQARHAENLKVREYVRDRIRLGINVLLCHRSL